MLAVIGGGEVGAYHARQLARAVAAGAVEGPVVVVDRDPRCPGFAVSGVSPAVATWSSFLEGWLEEASPTDHVIPAPFAPHLLWEWLGAAAGAVACAAPGGWGLPFEVEGGGGVRFLSAAAWTCPATCVEPGHCPVLHAPRDWDLAEVIEDRARELGWEPAVFRCYHLAFGIASVPVGALLEARARLAGAAEGTRCLVATSSHCHAAVGGLVRGVVSTG